jgi:acyl-CoA reductase-like NAD-dependent aldehyde dehydrogenase
VADGATTVTGGGRVGDQGYFVEPTVITNTRPDMKIVREEIFGPVVVAAPFRSLDEIAAEANNSSYGLGAGIWTRDISKAHALAKKLRAGTVWINCYNVFDASLPFGGYKQSGWGREMGHEVLEAYTEVKARTGVIPLCLVLAGQAGGLYGWHMPMARTVGSGRLCARNGHAADRRRSPKPGPEGRERDRD